MLSAYFEMKQARDALGIAPKPLNEQDTQEVANALLDASLPREEQVKWLELLTKRVPPGVDEAAKVKAQFLHQIAAGQLTSPVLNSAQAIELLGTMQGGYNVALLISLLKQPVYAAQAAQALKHTVLMFDGLDKVAQLAKQNNKAAAELINSWAQGEWFTDKAPVPEKMTLTVFKVPGEINTDDFSPAQDAWSRPDIPLHPQAMLKMPREGMVDNPLECINKLKENGYPIAFVGDVVGTGSSRKSAANSLLWHIGHDIPFVPNKRSGGVVLGQTIAPIFYNTLEDAGALPIEADVSKLNTGLIIDVYPHQGEIRDHKTNELITTFQLKSDMLLDSVRAGGRIPLILGRQLTDDSREHLHLPQSSLFVRPMQIEKECGFTLAQKIVGKACGVDGVYPGQYCQPKVTSVGSQDTTGPMTRDEIKDLACLSFKADLVLQTFCHTAPYPRPIDAENHRTMPAFFEPRGGVAIKPGDGIIHSWLNRMILPDTVGTGGDSHTRFPMGISFPAGSGLVAFAAATGMMPLDMPESVLVRFKGEIQEGITLRDLVHSIPYFAQKEGLLSVEKANKKNIFAGKVIEIEGVSQLSVEQAFELADATAERSAAGCTIALDEHQVATYLRSNVTLLNWMISQGYENKATLAKRVVAMEEWLANPTLLKADKNAEYAVVLEIDVSQIKEPLLCCPNDPDDVKTLSDVANTPIDEAFIGSCMTNIGHFRAAATVFEHTQGKTASKTWIAPPTKMDEQQLKGEGIYSVFAQRGVRTELPGCSLCMGNQAQVNENATVISTSTRNFPNRLGKGSQVYLGSAELAAVTAMLGHLPTPEQYFAMTQPLRIQSEQIYTYLDFSTIDNYVHPASHTERSMIELVHNN